MSTKVWLKRGAEVTTGTGSRSAAQVSADALDTTDFQQKLQDASLTDVLVHGYLGIIFGEPGWPYPEVQLTNNNQYIMVVFPDFNCMHGHTCIYCNYAPGPSCSKPGS